MIGHQFCVLCECIEFKKMNYIYHGYLDIYIYIYIYIKCLRIKTNYFLMISISLIIVDYQITSKITDYFEIAFEFDGDYRFLDDYRII